jgi:hypothetical protein
MRYETPTVSERKRIFLARSPRDVRRVLEELGIEDVCR